MYNSILLVLISAFTVQASAELQVQALAPTAPTVTTVPQVTAPAAATVTVPDAGQVQPVVVAADGMPTQYGPKPGAAPAKKEKSKVDPSMLQQAAPLLGNLFGGGGGGGVNNSKSLDAGNKAIGNKYVSQGKMEACPKMGGVPAHVDAARSEAEAFRRSCPDSATGDQQKIVINDYKGDGDPNWVPTMWIFDQNGNCIARTAITYGSGAAGEGKTKSTPTACSDGGEKLTPPGFHLTAAHGQGDGPYGPNNSMELVGLEGQGSAGRGILIHQAAVPGTASSWGCTGVCFDCYTQVNALLGFGALVYNYFGSPAPTGPNCNSKTGVSHSTSCRRDRGIPELAGGKSNPTATTLQENFPMGDATTTK